MPCCTGTMMRLHSGSGQADATPGEFDSGEDFFRDDFEILKMLPMPPEIARELWVRYVWSRALPEVQVF